MSTTSKSSFSIKDWKDTPSGELGGGTKITLTHAVVAYSGSISGEGVVEYLMCAGAEGVTHFTGFEKITGTLDGKSGSFTVQHVGTFAGEPKSAFNIVTGSGTGALAGVAGKGSYAANSGVMEFMLVYEL